MYERLTRCTGEARGRGEVLVGICGRLPLDFVP